MNKWLIGLGVVAALLAVTNPSRQDFNDWAVRYSAHKIDQQAQKEGREASNSERIVGGALVGLVVTNLPIKRRNFILFSIYSLDTDVAQPGSDGDNFPNCAIGVATQFIGFKNC